VPFKGLAAETDATEPEAADVTARPAADLAAVANAIRILAMQFAIDYGLFRQLISS
jgi:hypothetical protein